MIVFDLIAFLIVGGFLGLIVWLVTGPVGDRKENHAVSFALGLMVLAFLWIFVFAMMNHMEG